MHARMLLLVISYRTSPRVAAKPQKMAFSKDSAYSLTGWNLSKHLAWNAYRSASSTICCTRRSKRILNAGQSACSPEKRGRSRRGR
uniref:Putative secreted peptide n=1 Tax=Anopheles braziliensis TaxID=58242 RepID=A0A2M3ZSU6_9DIPT